MSLDVVHSTCQQMPAAGQLKASQAEAESEGAPSPLVKVSLVTWPLKSLCEPGKESTVHGQNRQKNPDWCRLLGHLRQTVLPTPQPLGLHNALRVGRAPG